MQHDLEATQPIAPYSRPLRVLIVGDDRSAVAALQARLDANGYSTVCASSSFMAHEALAEESFPIVIVDRALADCTPLCAELRNCNAPANMYIMVWGDCESRDDITALFRAGADDCLSKKASEGEIIARLNTARRIVRLERTLREALTSQSDSVVTEQPSATQARHALLKRVSLDLERALSSQRPLSVLALDVDRFKRVNDLHGYSAGDELLRQLANRVRFALPRDEDWIARVGGKELIVVLPGSDVRGATAIAERLRATVANTPFHIAGVDVDVTVSLGVGSLSLLDPEEQSAEALVDQAERHLYRSKLAGRDRVSAPAP